VKALISLLITFSILSSTGCGGQDISTNSFSDRESCREINRLIGSATDLMNSYNNGGITSLSGLAKIADSFQELSQKTSNSELKAGIVVLEEGVRLMVSEETFGSGSQLFVGEIMPILTRCQNT
jgi:hypothetical protein